MRHVLTKCDGGADTSENEEEGGNELRQVSLDRGSAKRVADASYRNLHHLSSLPKIQKPKKKVAKNPIPLLGAA